MLDAPASAPSGSMCDWSRRFAHRWNNFRASSLTLLRLGQGEGSLHRPMSVAWSDPRRERRWQAAGSTSGCAAPPSDRLCVRLKSTYLDSFLKGLFENRIPNPKRINCPVRKHAPPVCRLSARSRHSQISFQVIASSDQSLTSVNPVKISFTASVATARLQNGGLSVRHEVIGHDITAEFNNRLCC